MFFEFLILFLAVYFLLPRRRERIPRKSLKGLVRFVVEKFKDKINEKMENRKPAGFKTRLCKHFSKWGGSGVCPYGQHCNFIHPSDGELYQAFFSETLEFDSMLKTHLEECQDLHTQRFQSPDPTERQQLEDVINQKVRIWNLSHPKKGNYYDLHAMTTDGAIEYVHDIINFMDSNEISQSLLETGRGNHSPNNFPAIQTSLLKKFNDFNGASLVLQLGNDGILELSI